MSAFFNAAKDAVKRSPALPGAIGGGLISTAFMSWFTANAIKNGNHDQAVICEMFLAMTVTATLAYLGMFIKEMYNSYLATQQTNPADQSSPATEADPIITDNPNEISTYHSIN